jgi:ribosomal protein L40E
VVEMHHTIGYILSKPEDFKICLKCGRINWYENEDCLDCRGKRFRKATEKDVEELVAYLDQHSEHLCEECELDT